MQEVLVRFVTIEKPVQLTESINIEELHAAQPSPSETQRVYVPEGSPAAVFVCCIGDVDQIYVYGGVPLEITAVALPVWHVSQVALMTFAETLSEQVVR